jgi:hypothetical protein
MGSREGTDAWVGRQREKGEGEDEEDWWGPQGGKWVISHVGFTP